MLDTGLGTALYIPGRLKGVLHFKGREEELGSLGTFFLAFHDFRNTTVDFELTGTPEDWSMLDKC